MSKGKDIRATMESELENAAYEWREAKENGEADVKTKRGIFRGLAIARVILENPEDAEDKNAITAMEKLFLARVKD